MIFEFLVVDSSVIVIFAHTLLSTYYLRHYLNEWTLFSYVSNVLYQSDNCVKLTCM